MNEFEIVSKYLKPLSLKDLGTFKLKDDIFYDFKKGLALSLDTYVEGFHFINSKDPNWLLSST